ncbi:hypothetical protein ABEB36_004730 [Hypothenemus hampei]|uniref:Uncharacterized protein n=1 Tax=Hypothenemus hampei TaxID=57062 RepID=A0ABD1F483_HYPHA
MDHSPYHYIPVHTMEEGSPERRLDFCRFMLNADLQNPSFLKKNCGRMSLRLTKTLLPITTMSINKNNLPVATAEDLRLRIINVAGEIRRTLTSRVVKTELRKRMRLCIRNRGGHIEHKS